VLQVSIPTKTITREAVSLTSIIIIFLCSSPINQLFSIALPHLRHIVESLFLISIAYILVITVYFLGFIRLEVPSSFLTRENNDNGGTVVVEQEERKKSCHCSGGSTCTSSASLWLFHCEHNQHQYLCFPPYCSPGGLRSRLFPATATVAVGSSLVDCISIQEKQQTNNQSQITTTTTYHTTTNSTANPLDTILQNPYILAILPSVIKSTLQDCRDDWDTLGGSQCSFVRNSLVTHRQCCDCQCNNNCQQQQEVGRDNSCTQKEREEEIIENSLERSSFWERVNQVLFHSLASELNQQEEPTEDQLLLKSQLRQQEDHHPSASRINQEDESHTNPIITMTATDPPASTPTSVHETTNNESSATNTNNKVLPQAILVYHESAHSIVFRDHLRRQQGAIRRTSSIMEQQNNVRRGVSSSSLHSTARVNQKEYSDGGGGGDTTVGAAGMSRGTSTIEEVSETDEVGGGYESGGSTKSNRSIRSQSSNTSVKSGDADANSSVTSGGSSSIRSNSSRKKYLRKAKNSLPPLRKTTPSPTPSPPPSISSVVVANFQPVIEPLEALELNAKHVFEPLLDADGEDDGLSGLTNAEREVVEMLKLEKAVVKTVRNQDWTSFLTKFKPEGKGERLPGPGESRKKADDPNGDGGERFVFNSFVTSTSLLPSCAKKMRCFGSTNEYATGAVFALPSSFPNDASEDHAAKRTRTWSWPSGYSAKTEFNIDHYGNLINGREEALVPLSRMRQMNNSYLNDTDYVVGGRMVKGGLQTIPYNEVYVRVGGPGRISNGVDVSTDEQCSDANGTGRSFDNGIGLPVALFVREADYGHLVSLLRTRARFSSIFGRKMAKGIPLLYITPEMGVRVFTDRLQSQVLKTMAWDLNPFQNPSIAHKTSFDNTSEPHLQQKLEELLDLEDDSMKQNLTPEEMARIAGGFGATDDSVAQLLNDAMQRDLMSEKGADSPDDAAHNLQDLVNEGLAFALRANDFHTSRQLLILYSLVAAKKRKNSETAPLLESNCQSAAVANDGPDNSGRRESVALQNTMKMVHNKKDLPTPGSASSNAELSKLYIPPPPPPPPLDTDRLRSATNSDGLLAVLGAAQVLRAMQDGSAKRRVLESIESVEEWIENGEQSVAFRVASWRDQRAAQGDLKIAMESDSNFMAFISNKAIANRKRFAEQLKAASAVTDFDSLQFLQTIHSVLSQMNSPCLRLELLQYILGLDNRYSVAHVKRSVELAATCLNISSESDALTDEKPVSQ